MDKSITIVAPAYNHENYIEKCLHSLANQYCSDMELIIIDDKSKDNTVKIIEKTIANTNFKKHFERGVKFIKHQENKGAHYTINEGLQCANGNFLAVINTDDMFGDNHLKLLLDRCEKCNSEFAFGRIMVIDQNDSPVTTGYGQAIMKYQDTAKKCPTITMALTRGNSTISTGNMLFTKSIYNKLDGFRNYRYVHDWDFALRAALVTEPVFVPEAIYFYRLHTHNTISEISNNDNVDSVANNSGNTSCNENPLDDFFKCLLQGKYENNKIPSINVWNYFFRYKKYFSDDDDALWAWEQAKKKYT